MRHFLLPVWSRSHVYLVEDVVVVNILCPPSNETTGPFLSLIPHLAFTGRIKSI